MERDLPRDDVGKHHPAATRALVAFDALALALGGLVLAALAFLALNQPWVSDDFNNALFVRQHPGFWDAMVGGYQNWSGRFASTAFSWLAIQIRPVYGLVIWLGLLLLVVMIFALGNGRMPSRRRSDLYALGLLLLACWFGLPALEETVFWASGSPVYLWPAVATLAFLYPYRRWDPVAPRVPLGAAKRLGLAAGMLLLGVFVGGSQEQALAASLVFLGFATYRALHAGALRNVPGHLWAGVLGLVLAGAFSLAAPGNGARLSAIPEAGAWETLIGAAKYLVHIGVDWLPPLLPWLLCLALLALSGDRSHEGRRTSFPAWWGWPLVGFASLSPLLVKPYFGAERTVMYLAVFLLVGAVSLGTEGRFEQAVRRLPASTVSAVLAIVLLVTLADVGLSGWQARGLLLAQRHRETFVAGQKALGVRDVSVPPITDEVPRRGVAFGDGTADSSFWLNGILASYYGVDSVVVTEPGTQP